MTTKFVLLLIVLIISLVFPFLVLIFYKVSQTLLITKETYIKMGKIADLLVESNETLKLIDAATTKEGEEVKALAHDFHEALGKIKAMTADNFFQEKEEVVAGFEELISNLKSKAVNIQNIYTAPEEETPAAETVPEVKAEEPATVATPEAATESEKAEEPKEKGQL